MAILALFISAGAWPNPAPDLEPVLENEDQTEDRVEQQQEIPRQTIAGRIRLVAEDGAPIDNAEEFARAVAYFEPTDPGEVEPLEQRAEMKTDRRQFSPRVLLIQAGTEVIFPNEDPILHNVFSSSSGNRFNLGHYARGSGESHRFNSPGLVRVFCNVHPAMSAHIVVVNSPHYTHPGQDGTFELEDVPAVAGQLTIWHERAEPRRFQVQADQFPLELGEVELALTIRELRSQRDRRRRPARRGRY